MKRTRLLVTIFCCLSFVQNTVAQQARRVPFDADWRFEKGDPTGAEEVTYMGNRWCKVDLPHDWSIEDLPNQLPDSISGPFTKASIGGTATGFTVGGTGWYRKKFRLSKTGQAEKVSIYFDGVYMNSDVWLNGHHLGNHPYGFTGFYYDLTPFLKPAGGENVLAVRVRNEGKNSRWYAGSGIYRHVWLLQTGPVHIAPWGIAITTPDVADDKATVTLKTAITNGLSSGRTIQVVTTVISPTGKTVGSSQQTLTLQGNGSGEQTQSITVSRPAVWSVDSPQLYKAITVLKEADGRVFDKVETSFGIRSIQLDAEGGLRVNGKRVLLKGGCIHHDNGPLGAAAIDRAEERKIELLKANGFNAVRLSHNPPSQTLLDACDRLGMLVIDEAFDMWERAKNPQDYSVYFKDWWQRDLEAMVLRDRNHPSVIIWSIGNEISERADASGLRIATSLRDAVRRLDTTRAVTQAVNLFWDHPGYKWDTTAATFALLDVGGYNYQLSEYERDHQKHPTRIMLGTESYPRLALENWNMVEKHPYVIGDFVWTAMDYLGEASIGHTKLDKAKKFSVFLGWPWFNGYCGDLDLIGNKKPQSYYRDVVWRNRPITMAVHAPIPEGMVENVSIWGWPDEQQSWSWAGAEGKPLQVRVFSRAPLVRLLLNGNVIGEQKIAEGKITAVFNVPYQPGVLRAVNVVEGKETDATEFKTVGTPSRLRLVVDRTRLKGQNDLAYVMVEVTDERGQLVPNAELPIQFSISGAGQIAGVGSGNPTDVASFQRPEHKTWRGKCLVIVRPTGKAGSISLQATANGLTAARVVLSTK